jgi:hypothetical protein
MHLFFMVVLPRLDIKRSSWAWSFVGLVDVQSYGTIGRVGRGVLWLWFGW